MESQISKNTIQSQPSSLSEHNQVFEQKLMEAEGPSADMQCVRDYLNDEKTTPKEVREVLEMLRSRRIREILQIEPMLKVKGRPVANYYSISRDMITYLPHLESDERRRDLYKAMFNLARAEMDPSMKLTLPEDMENREEVGKEMMESAAYVLKSFAGNTAGLRNAYDHSGVSTKENRREEQVQKERYERNARSLQKDFLDMFGDRESSPFAYFYKEKLGAGLASSTSIPIETMGRQVIKNGGKLSEAGRKAFDDAVAFDRFKDANLYNEDHPVGDSQYLRKAENAEQLAQRLEALRQAARHQTTYIEDEEFHARDANQKTLRLGPGLTDLFNLGMYAQREGRKYGDSYTFAQGEPERPESWDEEKALAEIQAGKTMKPVDLNGVTIDLRGNEFERVPNTLPSGLKGLPAGCKLLLDVQGKERVVTFAKDVAKTSAEARMLPSLLWKASENAQAVNVRDEIVREYEQREKREADKSIFKVDVENMRQPLENKNTKETAKKHWGIGFMGSLFSKEESSVVVKGSGQNQNSEIPSTSLVSPSSENISTQLQDGTSNEQIESTIVAQQNVAPQKSRKEKIKETLKNIRASVRHCSCVRGD